MSTPEINYTAEKGGEAVVAITKMMKSWHNHRLLAEAVYNCLDRLDRLEVTGDTMSYLLKKELTRRFTRKEAAKEVKADAMA